MKTKFNILFILFMILLAACGTSKKESEQNTANQVDITRPPEFVKDGQLNTETNPDETISAEEWQQERNEK